MLARAKGNAGERAWRDCLNETFNTKYGRTPMSGAIDGLKGDVRKLPKAPATIADDFHWEVKRVEKINIHKSTAQAIRDAQPPAIPCVAFRRNHGEWMVCLRKDDFFDLLLELQQLRNDNKGKTQMSNIEKDILIREKKREYRRSVKEKYKK